MSIVNKIKDAVSSDKHHEQPQGTHGPHSSKVANTADPRIDSDRDHRANQAGHNSGLTGTSHTTGTHTTGIHNTHGTSGLTGTSHNSHNTNTTEGPHSHSLLNKADPRIDSDRSGGYTGNAAGDHGGSGHEGVAGPHSGRVANALDPRVDSDQDGSRNIGNTYGSLGTVGTGTGHNTTHSHTSGLTGPTGYETGSSGIGHITRQPGQSGVTGHSTAGHLSGLTGHNQTGQHGVTGHATPGPAPHTAGPHKSDVLNKVDPRVDSDLSGGKTYGGDKTFSS